MSDTADIIDRLCEAVTAAAPPSRALLVLAAAEIERLRFAIRRLAEQDATLSVCDGNVTVTMDATLTDEEREAIAGVLTGRDNLVIHDVWKDEWKQNCDTLRGLLERLGGGR